MSGWRRAVAKISQDRIRGLLPPQLHSFKLYPLLVEALSLHSGTNLGVRVELEIVTPLA
jgi:hypothetical protein